MQTGRGGGANWNLFTENRLAYTIIDAHARLCSRVRASGGQCVNVYASKAPDGRPHACDVDDARVIRCGCVAMCVQHTNTRAHISSVARARRRWFAARSHRDRITLSHACDCVLAGTHSRITLSLAHYNQWARMCGGSRNLRNMPPDGQIGRRHRVSHVCVSPRVRSITDACDWSRESCDQSDTIGVCK